VARFLLAFALSINLPERKFRKERFLLNVSGTIAASEIIKSI
jgi:hypothetical protein